MNSLNCSSCLLGPICLHGHGIHTDGLIDWCVCYAAAHLELELVLGVSTPQQDAVQDGLQMHSHHWDWQPHGNHLPKCNRGLRMQFCMISAENNTTFAAVHIKAGILEAQAEFEGPHGGVAKPCTLILI